MLCWSRSLTAAVVASCRLVNSPVNSRITFGSRVRLPALVLDLVLPLVPRLVLELEVAWTSRRVLELVLALASQWVPVL